LKGGEIPIYVYDANINLQLVSQTKRSNRQREKQFWFLSVQDDKTVHHYSLKNIKLK